MKLKLCFVLDATTADQGVVAMSQCILLSRHIFYGCVTMVARHGIMKPSLFSGTLAPSDLV